MIYHSDRLDAAVIKNPKYLQMRALKIISSLLDHCKLAQDFAPLLIPRLRLTDPPPCGKAVTMAEGKNMAGYLCSKS